MSNGLLQLAFCRSLRPVDRSFARSIATKSLLRFPLANLAARKDLQKLQTSFFVQQTNKNTLEDKTRRISEELTLDKLYVTQWSACQTDCCSWRDVDGFGWSIAPSGAQSLLNPEFPLADLATRKASRGPTKTAQSNLSQKHIKRLKHPWR